MLFCYFSSCYILNVHKKMDYNDGKGAIQRLKDNFERQQKAQREMIEAQIQYYREAKRIENERHKKSMAMLEEKHTSRVRTVKNQEAEYLKQLLAMKQQYSKKKMQLKRKHQQEMQALENREYDDDYSDDYDEPSDFNDAINDERFVEAVVAELLMLRNNQTEKGKSKHRKSENSKLRILADEMDSHFRLVHAIMSREKYM